MRPLAVLGVVLILCGILAFTYQGAIWVMGREKVAQVGPITVQRERPIAIPVAPIVGGALVVGGAIVLASAGREPHELT